MGTIGEERARLRAAAEECVAVVGIVGLILLVPFGLLYGVVAMWSKRGAKTGPRDPHHARSGSSHQVATSQADTDLARSNAHVIDEEIRRITGNDPTTENIRRHNERKLEWELEWELERER